MGVVVNSLMSVHYLCQTFLFVSFASDIEYWFKSLAIDVLATQISSLLCAYISCCYIGYVGATKLSLPNSDGHIYQHMVTM